MIIELSLAAMLAGLMGGLGWALPNQGEDPTRKIEILILELGAEDGALREKASEELLQI